MNNTVLVTNNEHSSSRNNEMKFRKTKKKFGFLLMRSVRDLRKYVSTNRKPTRKATSNFLFVVVSFILIHLFFILAFNYSGSDRQLKEVEINQPPMNIVSKYNNILTWTRVSDTVFVYSAFLDMRPTGRNNSVIPIRIIALWKLPPKAKILREQPLRWYYIKHESEFRASEYNCKVFYTDSVSGQLVWVQGEILTHKIFEEGLKVYAGTFFNCYIKSTFAEYLANDSRSVSIAVYPSSVQDYPTKIIPVKIIQKTPVNSNYSSRGSNKSTLRLCLRPLFGPMDDLAQLIQFLAYYALMGVHEFYFYDFGLSPRVRDFLSRQSFITLMKWNLPTGNWNELWDFGSLAALNDCVYRNMNSNWVVVVDLDEFMVPRGESNLNATIYSLLQDPKFLNYSQLLIRNTFYCKEYCQGFNQTEISILTCFNRTKRIWNVNLRSKFILKPRDILQVGHHAVTEFLEVSIPSESEIQKRLPQTKFRRFKSFTFPEDVLILNHYRECSPISTKARPILGRTTVEDKSILKYKKQILEMCNRFRF